MQIKWLAALRWIPLCFWLLSPSLSLADPPSPVFCCFTLSSFGTDTFKCSSFLHVTYHLMKRPKVLSSVLHIPLLPAFTAFSHCTSHSLLLCYSLASSSRTWPSFVCSCLSRCPSVLLSRCLAVSSLRLLQVLLDADLASALVCVSTGPGLVGSRPLEVEDEALYPLGCRGARFLSVALSGLLLQVCALQLPALGFSGSDAECISVFED